jgi:nucleotide-binding universal stress UspA family protein
MRVMLATDGSKDAQAAAGFLNELPLPPSSVVRITMVVTLPSFAHDVPSGRAFERSVVDGARGILDRVRAGLTRRGLTIETDVAVGDPKTEIVRIAEEWGADLLVLGARGLSAIKRFFLGSVSLVVANHVRCPVLVVKDRPRKLGRVLVALDGSEDSFRAVRFFQSFALPRQTKVRLLGVVELPRYPTSAPKALRGQLVGMLKELEAERRGQLEKALDQAATQLEDKITRVTRSTPTGDPADVIAASAASYNADLVVVGARGQGGMARLLLGSVSEKVLRQVRCPVLIVKEPAKTSSTPSRR